MVESQVPHNLLLMTIIAVYVDLEGQVAQVATAIVATAATLSDALLACLHSHLHHSCLFVVNMPSYPEAVYQNSSLTMT